MTKTTCTASTCTAARVVRHLRQEVDRSLTLIEHDRRQDDRTRGQAEALRHVRTVLDIQTGRKRRR